MTAISDKYAQLGGATGFLGAAVTTEIPAANGGYKQEFQNGAIYWQARTGAFEVHNRRYRYYAAIARLRNQVTLLTDRAHEAGCM